jgi:hypothetical protein
METIFTLIIVAVVAYVLLFWIAPAVLTLAVLLLYGIWAGIAALFGRKG